MEPRVTAYELETIEVDLSHPRIIKVLGIDKVRGGTREYLLKITPKGGLILV